MIFKGFTLDPFQEEAIAHLRAGRSVIVSAPTGAGKTLIAEYAVDHALREGERIIYTAPIKALSNQKFRDFSADYPGQAGLVTGDVTIRPDAPVLIMTTEIFRNVIFDDPARLDDVRYVVFDEVHYLDDVERGTVWEESIIFAPQHLAFICLSATVPNLEELAGWMNTVREREVKVVEHDRRPVPLKHFFVVDGRVIPSLKQWSKGGRRKGRFPRRREEADPLLEGIRDRGQLPCLYFTFSRKRCERLARMHRGLNLMSKQERREILADYDALALQYGIDTTRAYAEMRPLIARGVGFHHAGMLPSMKDLIERLFTSRRLKLIFTTETFALGINMPARTVVFDELSKFDGVDFRPMRTREYQQMAGRAGRRGMDKFGLVYAKINSRFMRLHQVREIVEGRPEPVVSQFNSCYATILNLYDWLGERIEETYEKSYHAYRSKKRKQRTARTQLQMKVRLLRELGYIDEEGLTRKGRCAARLYGHELLATELIFDSALDGLSPVSLAVLAMGLLYESTDKPSRRDLSVARPLMGLAEPAWLRVSHAQARLGIEDQTPRPNFGCSAVTLAWAQGAAFEQLLTMTSAPEGHLVRDFRRVVLLLRQLTTVTEDRPELQANLREAVRLVNRDVVDAERQLLAEVE